MQGELLAESSPSEAAGKTLKTCLDNASVGMQDIINPVRCLADFFVRFL